MKGADAHRRARALVAFLRDYLIPPRCPACGELVGAEEESAPFCPDCLDGWRREKLLPCAKCGLSMLECRCLPPLLTRSGIDEGIFLSGYRPNGGTVTDRLVYRIKEERDGRVFAFLARELAPYLAEFVRREGIAEDRVRIVPLPRRRGAVHRHGFDQAKELAKALSRETGYPYLDAICRAHAGREQKRLSAEDRRKNVTGAFRIVRGVPILAEETVFLVDDVVTTGSGLSECAELLFCRGALRVVPVLVARTQRGKA